MDIIIIYIVSIAEGGETIILTSSIFSVREFYYLLFLAVKFKIILVIGSIWAFGLVLAKIVAFFKISEYMKSK